MTFWETFWSVLFTLLFLVCGWELVDLLREDRLARKGRACRCGEYRILPGTYDEVHNWNTHVVHTPARCQPCREKL